MASQSPTDRIFCAFETERLNAPNRQKEERALKALRIYKRIELLCVETKLNNLDVVVVVDAIWDLVDETARDPNMLQLLPLVTFMRSCGSHVYAS